jgi:hypothetical protein
MSNSGQYRDVITIVGVNNGNYDDHSVWFSATERSHHHHFRIRHFHVTSTKPICIEEMLLEDEGEEQEKRKEANRARGREILSKPNG